jgi:hypothetical protein
MVSRDKLKARRPEGKSAQAEAATGQQFRLRQAVALVAFTLSYGDHFRFEGPTKWVRFVSACGSRFDGLRFRLSFRRRPFKRYFGTQSDTWKSPSRQWLGPGEY